MQYIDGLLEGHEGGLFKALYRFFMFSFVVLSLFSGASNVAMIGKEGNSAIVNVQGVAILALLGITLQLVAWHGDHTLTHKFKTVIIILICAVIVLDGTACANFQLILNPAHSTPASPSPTPPPPSPTNRTNMTRYRKMQLT